MAPVPARRGHLAWGEGWRPGTLAAMFIRYFLELPLPAEQVEAVLLGPAARWLEGLATDAGRRGEGLLAEVQVGPLGPHLASSLSPQEERILELVAEGGTNKEIGEELGLAEKTVKNYVSSILAKLEVARRAEAAAYLARHTTTPGS
jgi:DNA-binding CsgD family transcriptional regulator